MITGGAVAPRVRITTSFDVAASAQQSDVSGHETARTAAVPAGSVSDRQRMPPFVVAKI